MLGNLLTPTHFVVVLVVALLVLGPKRLPAAGRGIGEAIRGFKEAVTYDQIQDPTAVAPTQELSEPVATTAVKP
jgi:sec-independent protein translocase protein TatA